MWWIICVLSLMLNFRMELEFENQLNHYVELGDQVNFEFLDILLCLGGQVGCCPFWYHWPLILCMFKSENLKHFNAISLL